MDEELYQDIVEYLKDSEITIKFDFGGQGGIPTEVLLNSKKIGTYTFWNYEKKSHQDHHFGTPKQVNLANRIMDWDSNNYIGNYIDYTNTNDSYESLLADTYECSFHMDGEDGNELHLSIIGYGDLGSGEYITSGGMKIEKI